MPSFNVEVPHGLTHEQAVERVKTFLESARQEYGEHLNNLTGEWAGPVLAFAFSTFGFNIKGKVDVQVQTVRVSGDLPLAAMFFKGKVEQSIKEELAKSLG